MKKLFFSLALLLFSIAGFSQMMPDSTVQVCAYWQKGDKVTYECTNTTVKVTDGVDTTTVKASSETRIIEVVDQTDTSYLLQLTYKDVFNSDISAKQKFLVRTDENGVLKEVQDGEELVEQMRQDVSPLVFYHGGRYSLSDEYVYDDSFENIFDGANVQVETKFWIDTEDSDSSYVIIRSYSSLDNEALLPLLKAATRKVALSSGAVEEQGLDEMIDKSFADAHMNVQMETYSISVVHLDSGWTTYYYLEKHIHTVNDKEDVDTIVSTEINFVDIQ